MAGPDNLDILLPAVGLDCAGYGLKSSLKVESNAQHATVE